jgi:hypothetical protein
VADFFPNLRVRPNTSPISPGASLFVGHIDLRNHSRMNRSNACASAFSSFGAHAKWRYRKSKVLMADPGEIHFDDNDVFLPYPKQLLINR